MWYEGSDSTGKLWVSGIPAAEPLDVSVVRGATFGQVPDSPCCEEMVVSGLHERSPGYDLI